MSSQAFDVLIVGAGQAGASVAIHLRQNGFTGTVAMVGDEPDLPYERPPLSKAYLSGEIAADQLALRPAAYWGDQRVELMTGHRVIAVDAHQHEVTCHSGLRICYRHLVWAAGGHARRLSCPGADLAGVHVVRTRTDVDKLRNEVAGASNIVIIGGGYIGLETAAVLTKLGKLPTVLEAQARVLERVTSPAVSAFFEQEHRSHGVQIRTSTTVEALDGQDGRVSSVVLANGTRIPADLVVVGIGLALETGPLERAGATCTNGVDVDEYCRTSLPDIYAVGDCASHENRFGAGRRMRLESVQNANDQGKVAAANIAGTPTSYDSVPWFWSHQFDLKLQTVGLCTGYDAHVVRGSAQSRSFSVVYLRQGQVIALDCINAPRDYVQGRKLVSQGTRADPLALADRNQDLAQLAA